MLSNPKHVSEGPVLFTLTSGKKLMGEVRLNDPVTGYFEPLSYSDFVSAVPLTKLKPGRAN
jgi:hypothetical protein